MHIQYKFLYVSKDVLLEMSQGTQLPTNCKSLQNNLAEADPQLTNKFDKAVAGSLLIFTLQALT